MKKCGEVEVQIFDVRCSGEKVSTNKTDGRNIWNVYLSTVM